MKLIQRSYRLTPKQDAKVKREAKKKKMKEAEFIRQLIENYV